MSLLKNQLESLQKDLYVHYKKEGDGYILSVVKNMSLDDVAKLVAQSGADYKTCDKECWTKIINEFEENFLVPEELVWEVEKQDIHELYAEYDKGTNDVIDALTKDDLKFIAENAKHDVKSSENWWDNVRECFEEVYLQPKTESYLQPR